eukprot:TRINITY_DN3662_c0_g1_i1.p1 TRINITY_DN3662_c0_g1~~TRINITY_DN3662_c0_g1_i1.p1  ORF type:complete len:406 (-),score=85.24 TRINITY_DN3662_c0_g1_i1:79-1296(-)
MIREEYAGTYTSTTLQDEGTSPDEDLRNLKKQFETEDFVQIPEDEVLEFMQFLKTQRFHSYNIVGVGEGEKTTDHPVDEQALSDSIVNNWSEQIAAVRREKHKKWEEETLRKMESSWVLLDNKPMEDSDPSQPVQQVDFIDHIPVKGSVMLETLDMTGNWVPVLACDQSIAPNAPSPTSSLESTLSDSYSSFSHSAGATINFRDSTIPQYPNLDRLLNEPPIPNNPTGDTSSPVPSAPNAPNIEQGEQGNMFNSVPLDTMNLSLTDSIKPSFWEDWPSFGVKKKLGVVVSYAGQALIFGFLGGVELALDFIIALLRKSDPSIEAPSRDAPLSAKYAFGAVMAAALAITAAPELALTMIGYVMISGVVVGAAVSVPILVVGASAVFVSAGLFHSWQAAKRGARRWL